VALRSGGCFAVARQAIDDQVADVGELRGAARRQLALRREAEQAAEGAGDAARRIEVMAAVKQFGDGDFVLVELAVVLEVSEADVARGHLQGATAAAVGGEESAAFGFRVAGHGASWLKVGG
jgi:hypothetical protein